MRATHCASLTWYKTGDTVISWSYVFWKNSQFLVNSSRLGRVNEINLVTAVMPTGCNCYYNMGKVWATQAVDLISSDCRSLQILYLHRFWQSHCTCQGKINHPKFHSHRCHSHFICSSLQDVHCKSFLLETWSPDSLANSLKLLIEGKDSGGVSSSCTTSLFCTPSIVRKHNRVILPCNSNVALPLEWVSNNQNGEFW